MRNIWGFTLLELLITVSVIAILMALAVPSMTSTMNRSRVKAATEELHSQTKWARSEAIKRNGPLYMTIKTGNAWCYGFSTVGACDCDVANSCSIDGLDKVVDGGDYPNITIATTFAAAGVGNGFSFDKDGIPSAAGVGTVTVAGTGGVQGVVTLNVVGNVALTLP